MRVRGLSIVKTTNGRVLVLAPGLKQGEDEVFRYTRYARERMNRGQQPKNRREMDTAFANSHNGAEDDAGARRSPFGGQALTPILHFPALVECVCGSINTLNAGLLRVEFF